MELLTAAGIPQPRRAVDTTGGQPAAVRAKRHYVNPVLMASSAGSLRMTCIHTNDEMITEWVEPG
jgi:hypothetical protein